MKQLIIAEKPFIAQQIAEQLNSKVQERSQNKNFFQVDESCRVTWSLGKLFRPISETEVTLIESELANETILNLKKQIEWADEVVNVFDPDDNGDLFFDDIFNYLKDSFLGKPVKRFVSKTFLPSEYAGLRSNLIDIENSPFNKEAAKKQDLIDFRYAKALGTGHEGPYTAGLMSYQFLNCLIGQDKGISEGSLYGILKDSVNADPVKPHIATKLLKEAGLIKRLESDKLIITEKGKETLAKIGAQDFEHPDPSYPEHGSEWKHKNGAIYTVYGVSNTAVKREGHAPDVVYTGSNGNLWTRPFSDWHRSMSPVPKKHKKPNINQ